ncbi:RND superfamily putative drug exporter [Sediminihabitans luteus]|uniref:RND superfamily putative drug exporter n=1 Tax=Sediminihabitans luteus TaxID=1138585 RepID=A0A2M9CZ59_9CELL|nr:MMPL family transporter [Sediminihabitans luteus]PJJ77209.1 RND superfamily putative drug exporter [Sediminihabitans luteus]GII98657.1 membrane protein [Sediminihabitans luteus]
MAELLYRLGRGSARRAWLVVVVWILALAAAGGAYAAFGGTLSSAVTIPGTPTTDVTDMLEEEIPSTSGGTANIVFTSADDAPLTDDQQAAISTLLGDLTDVDGVSAAIDPFSTEVDREKQSQDLADGQAQLDAGRDQLTQQQAQLDAAGVDMPEQQAQLDAAADELDAQQAQIDQGTALLDMASDIRTVSEDGTTVVGILQFDKPIFEVSEDVKGEVRDEVDAAQIDGVESYVSADLAEMLPSLGIAEVLGVVIAAIVLFVMLGTIVAAGLPLINALVGVGVAALAALALSGSVEMMTATPMLGVMIGLAVGIDYSLFILHRHRRQLREGYTVEESIGLATGTSGTAVVFAGMTVFIALLALNVTGIPFLGVMGSVAAGGVLVAVLVAITLLPAMLGLVQERVLKRSERAARAELAAAPGPAAAAETAADPAADRPMSTPRVVLRLVLGVAALLVIAIPSLDMRLGLPDGSSEAVDSPQYQAYAITADKFGAGVNGPLLAVAELDEAVPADQTTAEQVELGQALMGLDDVVAVAPVGVSDDGTVFAFQVVPVDGPSSVSTEELVHTLRDTTVPGTDATFEVAGAASGNIDISEILSDSLPLYLTVVIGLSLLILILVFRSILLPVVATLGFILSLFAAFGGVTAIYQWGWLGSVFGVHDPGPVLNFLPTILIGVLFGLAMDYQLFIASGMREAYVHGAPARVAVVHGVRAGRAVVTAAAIIMISVFGGFVFSDLSMIRPIGFALAFGVLVDAFLVRMTIMPAVMHLAGDKAWWIPRWLDRIMPDVDVEGAALERHHPHAEADAPAGTPEESREATPRA